MIPLEIGVVLGGSHTRSHRPVWDVTVVREDHVLGGSRKKRYLSQEVAMRPLCVPAICSL